MEMNRETLEKMQQMRLQGMYYAFKTSLETLRMESMTIDQFVSWLVSSEWDGATGRWNAPSSQPASVTRRTWRK